MKLVCLLFLLLAGCGAALKDMERVNLRLRQDLTTLDPAYIVDVDGGRVAAKLFNGLVRYGENLQIVADLAERWEISEDGLTYRFWIRPQVFFSNGRELTAEDVRYSFERILEEKTLSPRRWSLSKIAEIQVVGSYELVLRLQEPYAPFLSLLTLPSAYIVPREEVERLTPLFGRSPVGTGPFYLKEWQAGTQLVLERNTRYFAGPAKVSRVVYRVLPEDFTATSEFERGGLDIMEIPRADFGHFVQSKTWSPYLHSQTGLNTYYVGFNCMRPPFNRREVRLAVAQAIPKEILLQKVLEARGELSVSPVPPLLASHLSPASPLPAYDLVQAILTLKQARLPLPLRAKLYFSQDKESLAVASFLKECLSKIGVELQLVNRDWSAFKEALNKGEADCFFLSWWADLPSVENFLFPPFYSKNFGGGGNRAFYSNSEVDHYLEEAQRALTPQESFSFYNQALSRIVADVPWVFLWHRKEFYVRQPRVKSFRLYPIYTMEKGTELELN